MICWTANVNTINIHTKYQFNNLKTLNHVHQVNDLKKSSFSQTYANQSNKNAITHILFSETYALGHHKQYRDIKFRKSNPDRSSSAVGRCKSDVSIKIAIIPAVSCR